MLDVMLNYRCKKNCPSIWWRYFISLGLSELLRFILISILLWNVFKHLVTALQPGNVDWFLLYPLLTVDLWANPSFLILFLRTFSDWQKITRTGVTPCLPFLSILFRYLFLLASRFFGSRREQFTLRRFFEESGLHNEIRIYAEAGSRKRKKKRII